MIMSYSHALTSVATSGSTEKVEGRCRSEFLMPLCLDWHPFGVLIGVWSCRVAPCRPFSTALAWETSPLSSPS
jgi:hypothetical protein